MEFKELQATDDGPASDARIRQFIDAWKEEFGEELSEGEARLCLAELVEFYRLVARPIPADPNPSRGLGDVGK